MIDDIDDDLTAMTDAQTATGLYANAEKGDAEGIKSFSQRGDASDEVDPRKLVRDPTLSEIRWYYRRTFANVLVDKPIDDAFKNGFETIGDNADEAERILDQATFAGEGDSFVGAYRLAEKKARRDGFSLIFLGTEESGSAGIHESPIDEDVDVDSVSYLKVLTIDDLTETAPHEEIQEGTGLDETQYRIRDTGMVINTDISSRDYRTPVGYVLDGSPGTFIHKDRVLHLTWNPEVDGDYLGQGVRRWNDDNTTLGQYEGDSVLIPTYDLLKGISKGNWAVMQALFRNASHVYSVKLPPDADEEDFGFAVNATQNINAKSSFVWPSVDYEFDQHESGNQMEPEQHYEALFDQVCAGQEMTKSVLFGTQAGTVSGSETDIKNYFNKVERYRGTRAEGKIEEYVTRVKKMEDSRTSEDFEFDMDIEWGPMFQVDQDTRVTMFQNEANALTTLIGSFALTPDEARSILSEEFADVDLGDMSEDQMDVLDRINLTRSGQGTQAVRSEKEYAEGPERAGTAANEAGGRQGGMSQGQQTASGNPASDSDETAIVEEIERLAELHEDGVLSDDEFDSAKAEVISND
jgi:hypothetical protein